MVPDLKQLPRVLCPKSGFQGSHCEVEVCVQKGHWGVLSGSTPEGRWGSGIWQYGGLSCYRMQSQRRPQQILGGALELRRSFRVVPYWGEALGLDTTAVTGRCSRATLGTGRQLSCTKSKFQSGIQRRAASCRQHRGEVWGFTAIWCILLHA